MWFLCFFKKCRNLLINCRFQSKIKAETFCVMNLYCVSKKKQKEKKRKIKQAITTKNKTGTLTPHNELASHDQEVKPSVIKKQERRERLPEVGEKSLKNDARPCFHWAGECREFIWKTCTYSSGKALQDKLDGCY